MEAGRVRRLAALVLVLSIAVPAVAQDETLFPQDQTLFPEEFKSGYFGGPVLTATSISDEFGLMVGARGGWIVNRKIVLGAGVHYLVNSIGIETTVPDTIAPVDTTFDMMLVYGGPEFEYINKSHDLVHYTVSILIGAGMIDYKEFPPDACAEGEACDLDADVFFVVEPSVSIMLNVTSMFRIGLGLSYRYVQDVELKGIEDEELRGPSGILTAKIGRF
jgi:hypothetical protein